MHQVACTPIAADDQTRLIETRGLVYRYPDGRAALDGIDLVIQEGDRVALVGHNGAGKTTLAKLLAGVYRPFSGEVLYRGCPADGNGAGERRPRIGMLFQDPDDQLFCNSLREDVAFGPLNLGLGAADADERVERALRLVDLGGFLYKAPHHLSYGQRKRAAFAAVLAMDPEVLILDEPTANLDTRQERLFWELLREYTGTLVVISHDLTFLYGVCDRAVVVEAGRVHHDTGMKDLVTEPQYLRSHGLGYTFQFACCGGEDFGGEGYGEHVHAEGSHEGHVHHDHDHGAHVHPHDADAGHSHAAHVHEAHDHGSPPHGEEVLDPASLPHGHYHAHAHAHDGLHDHVHPHEEAGSDPRHVHYHAHENPLNPHAPAPPSGPNGDASAAPSAPNGEPGASGAPVLDVKEYSYRYPDGTWGLREVSLAIGPKDRVALVGENGAGKSTLALSLAGLTAGRGEIRLNGNPPRKKGAGSFAPEVGLVFQDPSDQLFCPSCREEVAFGPEQLGLGRPEVAERVSEALGAVGLAGFEDRVPTRMSAGERKRLAIASVLAMRPGVLILDEPTANLDPASEELLMEVLSRVSVPMVLVSHDLRLIAGLCGRVLVMHRGRIVRDYSTRELLRDDRLVSLNGLDFTFKNACCREILALQEKAKGLSGA